MNDLQRRESHEALLDAKTLEDLPGKWQAAILKAPSLRIVRRAYRREAGAVIWRFGLAR